ncbi:RNA polymerase sigma factor [Allokutzneria sp. A3M-2-11 16]|uniref:RNA polymerase sigma factor n=1 Tax=Allokutzneria sp. A3M-2-11 16 TaxID=2962043 RepID=UPI0020B7E157|nr:RNA polymerase sigma factor [Allokutzneria sp. A3M-2-11 16]MCP3800173.1 RNA polymerase sigma factor [Allokutzneria sp. A3M-2-11 16]
MSRPDPKSALAELYDSAARQLHRYLARRVGTEVADDLVAETFLVLWQQRDSVEFGGDSARAWMYGIATNLVRRHARSEERRLRAWTRDGARREEVADVGDRAVDLVDAGAVSGHLAPMLAELPERDRDVLLMSAWTDLSPTEIAESLDMHPVTVRTCLHRVRGRLRKQLATRMDAKSLRHAVRVNQRERGNGHA